MVETNKDSNKLWLRKFLSNQWDFDQKVSSFYRHLPKVEVIVGPIHRYIFIPSHFILHLTEEKISRYAVFVMSVYELPYFVIRYFKYCAFSQ